MVQETLDAFIDRITNDPPSRQITPSLDFWQILSFDKETEGFNERLIEKIGPPNHKNIVDNALEMVDHLILGKEVFNKDIDEIPIDDGTFVRYLIYLTDVGLTKKIKQRLPKKKIADYGQTREIESLLRIGPFVMDDTFGKVFKSLDVTESRVPQKYDGKGLFDSVLSKVLEKYEVDSEPGRKKKSMLTLSIGALKNYVTEFKLARKAHNSFQSDLSRSAEEFEKIFIPTFVTSASMMDALYFDLRNLVLDDYMHGGISSMVKSRARKSNLKMKGFDVLLYKKRAANLLLSQKDNYVRTKHKEREQKMYMIPALSLYSDNLLTTLGDSEMPASLLFNMFKQQEFWDCLKKGDFKGYLESIKNRTDFGSSVGPVIKKIKKFAGDEGSLAYLNLFTGESNIRRSPENIAKYTDDYFMGMWINAFKKGWGESLFENMDSLEIVLDNRDDMILLGEQDSSDLVDLLEDLHFRNYYLSNENVREFNFSLLARIQKIDNELFEKVFPVTTKDDDKFLKSIFNLATKNGKDYSGLVINKDSKIFISHLDDIDENDTKPIFELLNNYDAVQTALDFRLVPQIYSGKISNIEDKVGFARWFSDNKDNVLGDVGYIPEIQKYLGKSRTSALVRHLLKIAKKPNSKFMDEHLNSFFNTLAENHPIKYQKLCELFANMNYPTNICKTPRRNQALMSMLTADEDTWGSFRDEMVKSSGSCKSYDEVFEKHNAFSIARAKQHASKYNGETTLIEDAYLTSRKNDKEQLYNRLDDLYDLREINRKMFEMVCSHLANSQFVLADRFVTELEKGRIGIRNVENLGEAYMGDKDINEVPLESLAGYVDASEVYTNTGQDRQDNAADEVKVVEFDYTAFEQYVMNVGFHPAHVRHILCKGFNLKSGNNMFISENYTPVGHVRRKSFSGDIDGIGQLQSQFTNILDWLYKEGAIKHKVAKGKSLTDSSSCIALVSHLDQIAAEPLREFIGYHINQNGV